MQPSDPTVLRDRRRFLKVLGLVGMSSALGTAAIRLDSAAAVPSTKPAAKTAAKPAAPPAAAPAEPEISEDARTLTTIVQRRYGKHLDAKQLVAVTEEIEFRLQAGKRLRAAKLANGDGPDTVFRA